MKGTFIAIEGIDACGKGTIIKRLATDLYDANKNNHIFLTREPFEREWLKKFLSQLDPISQGEAALKLFVEDRTKHCKSHGSRSQKRSHCPLRSVQILNLCIPDGSRDCV